MQSYDIMPLVTVVARLLAPGGCPWDQAQDHASLRKHMLEEAYEVCDAIDRKDMANLREELGDVLYQIVFHAQLAEEAGAFDLQDVIDEVAEKMKRRHPHIYPPADGTVLNDWESIKQAEKAGQPSALPEALPATMALRKLSGKLAKQGLGDEALLALCDSDLERRLLALVMEGAADGQDLELVARGLAQRMGAHLEKAQN